MKFFQPKEQEAKELHEKLIAHGWEVVFFSAEPNKKGQIIITALEPQFKDLDESMKEIGF